MPTKNFPVSVGYMETGDLFLATGASPDDKDGGNGDIGLAVYEYIPYLKWLLLCGHVWGLHTLAERYIKLKEGHRDILEGEPRVMQYFEP